MVPVPAATAVLTISASPLPAISAPSFWKVVPTTVNVPPLAVASSMPFRSVTPARTFSSASAPGIELTMVAWLPMLNVPPENAGSITPTPDALPMLSVALSSV